MTRSKWFLLFVVSFLLGIIAGEFLLNDDFLKIAFLIFFWILGLGILFCNEKYFVYLFSLIAVFIGLMRFFISFENNLDHIKNYEGYFKIEGCIVDEVDVRRDKVKYTLDTERIFSDEKWKNVEGRILINTERYPVYEYGDCLNVFGKIQIPESFDSFAYDKYLSRYSIYAVMYNADVRKLSSGGGNCFYKYIYRFKEVFEDRMSKIFSEPHGSFMSGLILGSRRGIPEHLMDNFNITGLTHIIAISGYNITLVIVVIGGIFSFLSRKFKVIVCIFFIIVFTLLVGASAAVTRAAIMGIISLIALWYGRPYLVILSLFSAAFVMNLWNPKILVYDVGFQLSFLATFGIIVVSTMMDKYFKWLPDFFGIREAVIMTLSAQIFALPVIILNFGRLSIISPVANVFVLPLIPLSMVFGFFAVLTSFIWDFIGNFIGFFGFLFLELIIFFVKVFASFSFSSVQIKLFPWWILFLYYWLLFRKLIIPMLSHK
ncbi:DUF4131 domain-containing protein [Candidatus Peregrinibacteria bacterium]|nr:DUF4131 domain-containing protein [Candidatus Peregrinibacteria bacterium]